jgi:hypothetical protein
VFLRFKTYGSALRPGEEDRNESIELSALPSSQEHHNFPSLFFKAYFLLLAQFFSLLNLSMHLPLVLLFPSLLF